MITLNRLNSLAVTIGHFEIRIKGDSPHMNTVRQFNFLLVVIGQLDIFKYLFKAAR